MLLASSSHCVHVDTKKAPAVAPAKTAAAPAKKAPAKAAAKPASKLSAKDKALKAQKATKKGVHTKSVRKVRTSVHFYRPKTLRLARKPKYDRKSAPTANKKDQYQIIKVRNECGCCLFALGQSSPRFPVPLDH